MAKFVLNNAPFPHTRMVRLRRHPVIRDLVRETAIDLNDLIFPLFIHHGHGVKREVSSMPGLFQLSVDQLPAEIAEIQALGIPAVLLFGIPEQKDSLGSDSYCENGIVQQAIKTIKALAPELLVISDICFCEYTDHGHCGVVTETNKQPNLDHDATLKLLAKQAVSHAQAGADMLAPSGNIDGMVGAIRQALDQADFINLPILSYSVKYASACYGPFREATQGVPQFGDRRSYQMDPANSAEAMREVALDLAEGADMTMVKPAMLYLDIINQVKQNFPGIPLAAYQVSGEYAMIKAAADKGWLDEQRVVMESLIAIKRAGADMIITYFAKQVAQWIRQ